ncbi:MAG: DMT family transporter [Deltaproteobacteria bacterium]|nr:MAG: DMT family transporter [Deltaproteobacteria bacterium]
MSARVALWIVLAQAIGGSTPALTKLALAGLSPWSLVVVRQSLGLLILLGVSALRRPDVAPAPLRARDLGLLLVLAWGGFALPMVLNAIGLELSTATNGALLSPLEPIGILIGGALLLREVLTAPRVVAIALGAAGGTLIVLQGTVDIRAGDPRGDALMALGHLSWAIYTLAAKPLLRRHDPLRVAMLATALSVPPLIPLALAEPFDAARALPALGWVFALAFLSTALISYAWNAALREISASTLAVFIFLQPLVGLVIGALLLGEPVGGQALAGAVLIVLGVTLAALRGES